jgi:hypothetical protein
VLHSDGREDALETTPESVIAPGAVAYSEVELA